MGFSSYYQYVSDMMPSTPQLGTSYTSMPVGFGPAESGYVIRVVPASMSTEVEIPGLLSPIIRNRGEFVELEIGHCREVYKVGHEIYINIYIYIPRETKKILNQERATKMFSMKHTSSNSAQ